VTEEGQLAGRYEIQQQIGAGAMGQVVEARDQWLNRQLAVKRLIANDNTTLRRRFIEEAQITGSLSHPNIIPVHELGQDPDKGLYIAMKLVQGMDLHEIIQGLSKGKPSFTRVYGLRRLLRLFLKICEAMAFAHKAGFLHRDLKPANIMIGEGEEVLVMDWGLAKSYSKRAERDGAKSKKHKRALKSQVTESDFTEEAADLTQDGALIGTPMYMSPEQADDPSSIDIRADIYSLGAILYELLTYKRPYNGTTIVVISALFRGPPPRPQVAAPERKIDPALEAIVCKAMARQPGRRYDNALALAADIEAFLDGRLTSTYKESFGKGLMRVVRQYSRYLVVLLLTILIIAGTLIYSASLTRNLERVALEQSLQAQYRQASVRLSNGEVDFILGLTKQRQAFRSSLKESLGFVADSKSALDIDELTDRHKLLRKGEQSTQEGKQGFDSIVSELKKSSSEIKINEFLKGFEEQLTGFDNSYRRLTSYQSQRVDIKTSQLKDKLAEDYSTASARLKQELKSIKEALKNIRLRLDRSLVEMYIAREPERFLELWEKQKSTRYKGVHVKLEASQSVIMRVRALIRKGRPGEARTILDDYLSNSEILKGQKIGGAADLTKLLALQALITIDPQMTALKTQRERFDSAISVDSTAHWLYVYRAEILARLGQFDAARRDYLRASTLRPIDGWIELSRLKYLVSDDPVWDIVDAAISGVWSFAPLCYEIAVVGRLKRLWSLSSYQKYKEYLQAMAQSEALSKNQALQYSALGGLLISAFEDSESFSRQLLKADLTNVIGLGCLAEALLHQGKVQQARRVAVGALERYPEDGRLNFVVGEALQRNKDYLKALPYLRLGARPSLKAYRWLSLARCLSHCNDSKLFKEGILAGRRALSLDYSGATKHQLGLRSKPNAALFHETLAVLRKKQGKLGQAILHFEKAALDALEIRSKKAEHIKRAFKRHDDLQMESARLYEALRMDNQAALIYKTLSARKNKPDKDILDRARSGIKRLAK
jgi:serine/threonine protein kinase